MTFADTAQTFENEVHSEMMNQYPDWANGTIQWPNLSSDLKQIAWLKLRGKVMTVVTTRVIESELMSMLVYRLYKKRIPLYMSQRKERKVKKVDPKVQTSDDLEVIDTPQDAPHRTTTRLIGGLAEREREEPPATRKSLKRGRGHYTNTQLSSDEEYARRKPRRTRKQSVPAAGLQNFPAAIEDDKTQQTQATPAQQINSIPDLTRNPAPIEPVDMDGETEDDDEEVIESIWSHTTLERVPHNAIDHDQMSQRRHTQKRRDTVSQPGPKSINRDRSVFVIRSTPSVTTIVNGRNDDSSSASSPSPQQLSSTANDELSDLRRQLHESQLRVTHLRNVNAYLTSQLEDASILAMKSTT